MGCDIHAHVEVKINGEWQHYAHPSVDRNYVLFGRLAGVRGSEEPISQPRGLPDGLSFMTQFDRQRWEGDAHSDSWLSAQEVASLNDWVAQFDESGRSFYVERKFGFIFGNGWDIAKYPNEYPEGVEDARLVFWFDN